MTILNRFREAFRAAATAKPRQPKTREDLRKGLRERGFHDFVAKHILKVAEDYAKFGFPSYSDSYTTQSTTAGVPFGFVPAPVPFAPTYQASFRSRSRYFGNPPRSNPPWLMPGYVPTGMTAKEFHSLVADMREILKREKGEARAKPTIAERFEAFRSVFRRPSGTTPQPPAAAPA